MPRERESLYYSFSIDDYNIDILHKSTAQNNLQGTYTPLSHFLHRFRLWRSRDIKVESLVVLLAALALVVGLGGSFAGTNLLASLALVVRLTGLDVVDVEVSPMRIVVLLSGYLGVTGTDLLAAFALVVRFRGCFTGTDLLATLTLVVGVAGCDVVDVKVSPVSIVVFFLSCGVAGSDLLASLALVVTSANLLAALALVVWLRIASCDIVDVKVSPVSIIVFFLSCGVAGSDLLASLALVVTSANLLAALTLVVWLRIASCDIVDVKVSPMGIIVLLLCRGVTCTNLLAALALVVWFGVAGSNVVHMEIGPVSVIILLFSGSVTCTNLLAAFALVVTRSDLLATLALVVGVTASEGSNKVGCADWSTCLWYVSDVHVLATNETYRHASLYSIFRLSI
jgi:hypothetical protein